jgi:hypothetical protein
VESGVWSREWIKERSVESGEEIGDWEREKRAEWCGEKRVEK